MKFLLTIAALLAAGSAWANGVSLPDTVGVALRPGSPKEIGLETNFGWLSSRNGHPFTWVCHETVLPPTNQLTPFYYLGPHVTFVTVRGIGQSVDPDYSLFRSTDGCNWDAPPDLEGVNIREIAFDPFDVNRALATTFTGSGAANGIWVTEDAGVTWAKTPLHMPQRFFRSVEFAPSRHGRIYATATWFEPGPQAWVYVSDDGGSVWTEIPWTFTVAGTLNGNVDIVAVSATDENVAYARTNGGDDYLLRTADGGQTWTTVFFSNDEDIRGITGAWDGSGVFVSTVTGGVHRAEDGVTFVPVAPGIEARGLASDERGLFAVSDNVQDGFALGVSTDGGATFAKIFQFAELAGPRRCPDDSDVAVKCAPGWPTMAQKLFITPTPVITPPRGDDGDEVAGSGPCACTLDSAAPAAPALTGLGLLLLAMAIRRRHR